ncbi:hypothetical protein FACS1894206_02350 [Deltaproteobacteria bacterium]|nr:hypothetical protein FACS1894206_02350 [Deltaproteobacteria bacterium]
MKRTSVILAALLMLFGAATPVPEATAAQSTVNVSIGTSSLGGNFFTMGAVISDVLSNKLGYRSVAQATGGSAFNVDGVHNKELDTAICQATAIAMAFRGTGQFKGAPVTDVRSLFNWNATPVHMLVRRSIKAAGVTDLNNARLECMTPGDGIEVTTKMFAETFGLDKVKLEYSGNRVQSSSRFKTGGVDAILDATGVGASWMSDVIGDGSTFMLLSLTPEQIAKVVAAYPEMTAMTIPANTYKGQTEAVVTVGNWTTLIAHESMPDEVAYNITKAAFDNKETFVKGHNFFKDLAPENVVNAVVAPLHPGAAKYYKEIGVLK